MTWFWYITKNYLRYFFVSIFIFLFIVTLFDFIDRSGNYFQKYDPPWPLVLKFYLYQIPGLFVQSLPFGALIASVVCFVNLSRKNEIVAFRAAGLSVARMSLPLVVCCLLYTSPSPRDKRQSRMPSSA